MLQLLKTRLLEVLQAVAPLVAVVSVLQFAVVHAPAALFVQFLAGSVLAALGMLLLFIGIDVGILPMGRFLGAALPERRSLALIVIVAFSLGFGTTVAEPDVLVLSGQVEEASRGAMSAHALTYLIAAGVGLFTALALLRVVWGVPMTYLLAAVYAIMLLLSFAAPAEFVPLAYDAGSVTTGVLSAPVVLAFALGFTSVLARRSPLADGFGLLGFASVGPIVAILLLGSVLQ
jgi:hypothetical protein